MPTSQSRSKKKKTIPSSVSRVRRRGALRALWLIPVLLLAGALLDPALIPPTGPFAGRTQKVSANFTACGIGRGNACVIDGDTFKLGERKIRITGIDAPEMAHPLCPAEAALARRSADRLRALLNEGGFDMIPHRLHPTDSYGRELMVVERNGVSIGGRLVDEGLAHRYRGSKRSWC